MVLIRDKLSVPAAFLLFFLISSPTAAYLSQQSGDYKNSIQYKQKPHDSTLASEYHVMRWNRNKLPGEQTRATKVDH